MRRTTTILGLAAMAMLGLGPADALAGGARSFVSGGGTDTGTCERVAPCRTFGYAMTQTNAGGEVVAIDSSGYGAVTIDKSITLTAARGVFAGISPSSGNAITVSLPNDGSSEVQLRHLRLRGNGATSGIRATAFGGRLRVHDVTASGFTSQGLLVGSGTGNPRVVVTDSEFERNDAGVELISNTASPMRATLTDTAVRDNTGTGMLLRSSTSGQSIVGVVTRAEVVGNGVTGIQAGAVSTPANGAAIVLDDSVVSGNVTGVLANVGGPGGGGVAQVLVSRSTIRFNTTGVAAGAQPGATALVNSAGDNLLGANNGGNAFIGAAAPRN